MSIKFECQSIIFTATELWFPEILGQYKLCVHIVLYLLYIYDHLNSTILNAMYLFSHLYVSHIKQPHILWRKVNLSCILAAAEVIYIPRPEI